MGRVEILSYASEAIRALPGRTIVIKPVSSWANLNFPIIERIF